MNWEQNFKKDEFKEQKKSIFDIKRETSSLLLDKSKVEKRALNIGCLSDRLKDLPFPKVQQLNSSKDKKQSLVESLARFQNHSKLNLPAREEKSEQRSVSPLSQNSMRNTTYPNSKRLTETQKSGDPTIEVRSQISGRTDLIS